MNYTRAFNQQGVGAVVRSLFKTNERKRCVRTKGNFKKTKKRSKVEPRGNKVTMRYLTMHLAKLNEVLSILA